MKKWMYGATKGKVYSTVIVSASTQEKAMKKAQKELKTRQVIFVQEVR